MRKTINSVLQKARAFAAAKRGNVAMMFAISLVPLTIAAGVGLDFARAAMVRNAMSEALDSAALAVGATSGMTTTTATTLAQQYFNANYKGNTTEGAPTCCTVTYNSAGSVTVSATDQMPATLLKIAGYTQLPVTASSTVVWGQSKLWVALALDNSGSMSQGDSTGSKMDALQNALTTSTTGLLAVLQHAASTEGDVKVTLVPFSNMVNVNGAISSTYLDYREWDAQPPLDSGYMTVTTTMSNGIPFEAYGAGADCPFDGTDGYYCVANSTNDNDCSADNHGSRSSCLDTIPSGGNICPSMHGYSSWTDGSADRFYNGCYTSTKSGSNKVTWTTTRSNDCNHFPSSANCSSTGSSTKTYTSQKYTHVWTVNAHSTWGGCVTDRQRNGGTTYGASASTLDRDTYNTAPSTANGYGDTLFPTLNTDSCLSATVVPLPTTWSSSQWTTLSNKINAMSPSGSTNQAIGVEHAWQTLTPGSPYGAPTVPTNTARFLIIFSDGQNTQDRWYGNGRVESTTQDANIDTRTTDACAHAKADGVIIYSIYVNVGGNSGNSAPLQTCATDSSKYFALTSTSAIVTTFAQIAQQITNVRVSQ